MNRQELGGLDCYIVARHCFEDFRVKASRITRVPALSRTLWYHPQSHRPWNRAAPTRSFRLALRHADPPWKGLAWPHSLVSHHVLVDYRTLWYNILRWILPQAVLALIIQCRVEKQTQGTVGGHCSPTVRTSLKPRRIIRGQLNRAPLATADVQEMRDTVLGIQRVLGQTIWVTGRGIVKTTVTW